MSKYTLSNLPTETATGCVYLLTFPNNKHYVGITRLTIKDRLQAHIKNVVYKSNKLAITHAIRKYGFDSVTVEVLHSGIDDESVLYATEKEAILKYNSYGKNGYNLTVGGEGSFGWFANKDDDSQTLVRERSSRVLKKLWTKPGFREAVVAATKLRSNTPEFKQEKANGMRRLNSDPDFVKIRDATLNKARLSEKWRKNFDNSIVERSKNPEWIKSQGERLRRYYSDPKNKSESLLRLAEMNADPEFQKRRIDSCRASWKNPKLISEQSARNKAKALISERDHHQVVDLYNYGFTGKEIAKLFCVKSHQTIYNILAKQR